MTSSADLATSSRSAEAPGTTATSTMYTNAAPTTPPASSSE
ncbi:hypothetical protein ABH926_002496 [Catenulispora sp. GP43]